MSRPFNPFLLYVLLAIAFLGASLYLNWKASSTNPVSVDMSKQFYPASLSFKPLNPQAKVGQEMVTTISLDGNGLPLTLASLELTYPADSLTFNSLTYEGSPCLQPITPVQPNAGDIRLECRLPDNSFQQQILPLVTLHFTALKAGNIQIHLTSASYGRLRGQTSGNSIRSFGSAYGMISP